MHVVIVTAGSAGDVHPFAGLARALRARGHDVDIFANEIFGDVVRSTGAGFVEHGTEEEFRAAERHPDLWAHPSKGLKVVLGLGVIPALEPTLESIKRLRRDDTVLVAGTLALGARVAQEVLGLPLATVHLAPSVFRTVHRMPRLAGLPSIDWAPKFVKRWFWRVSDKVIDPMIAPRLNELRVRHGLAPVSAVFGDWMHSPQLVVGLFPEWFAPPQPDWPAQVKLTGFPLFDESDVRPEDPALSAWLDAGDAPIVFTAGSSNVGAHAFFRESAAACARMRRRGLLVTSNRDSAPAELPDGVRWERYVPFSRVLSRAAALVSHGGIGTVSQGLAAGIPQLVTPISFDQFDNASRVEDLKVGLSLPQKRYTAARAVAAFDKLLGRPVQVPPMPGDPLGATVDLIGKLVP
ncbi:MAG: glycosyltransferase [Planctomycetota bacterium]|jgi:UDP:flavonoid glycosyltransferase YjiC (YdhE family)